MVATLVMQSCRKDSDIIDVTPTGPQEGLTVNGSVMGTVIDESGQPVIGAEVTYGNLVESTDEYGVFQFNDETLYSDGTYIEVEKDGYFHGSRKFYPVANTTSRVTVELLSMVEIVSFASSAGEKVQFEGTEIAFGNNSIMNADGSDYNGNVKVFAKYLDPTVLATLNQMPGDLTAMNVNDERVVLTSYGMIAVELRDDAGNELQVKTGMTVDVSTPVPTELIGSAPQTIPMWHFDEDLGTWVEEGEATLVNGVYETQVSHFSFWNYDVPSNFIHLSGSILNRGIPVQNVLVKITNTDNGTTGTGITNENGVFGGYVPNGIELIVEIYDQCGSLIYSFTVGPYSEDVVLDPLNLSILVDQVSLSGSVTSCEGEPSDATYVVVQQGESTNVLSLDENNAFESNIFYCNADSELIVGAVDPVNSLVSANSTFSIEGDVDAGVLDLCEASISQHIYYQYGDQEFGSNLDNNGQDSLWGLNYTLQVIPVAGGADKELYTVAWLDWNMPDIVYSFTLIYQEGLPMQQVTMPVTFAGFNVSGEATIQKVEQGGQVFITATGTLSDVTITDTDLYDPSYIPLFFSTAVKL